MSAAAFTFTKGERAAVLDRLGLADCIADALTEAAPGQEAPTTASHDQVIAAVEAVQEAVRAGTIDPATFDRLKADVLIDAIEGSTYAAGFDNYHDAAKKRGALRCLRSAAEKIITAGLADDINVRSQQVSAYRNPPPIEMGAPDSAARIILESRLRMSLAHFLPRPRQAGNDNGAAR